MSNKSIIIYCEEKVNTFVKEGEKLPLFCGAESEIQNQDFAERSHLAAVAQKIKRRDCAERHRMSSNHHPLYQTKKHPQGAFLCLKRVKRSTWVGKTEKKVNFDDYDSPFYRHTVYGNSSCFVNPQKTSPLK